MPREVEHDATGPYVLTPADIDPDHGDIAVCRCGLSPQFPFCDGSHRATRDEDPDVAYRYPDGPDGERRAVADAENQGGEVGGGVGCAEGVVAVHEAHGPRIIDSEDLAAVGGRLELDLSDLATEVRDGPESDR